MSQPVQFSAAELLRRWVETWNAGDWDAMRANIDPEVTTRPDPIFPAPVVHGIDALQAFLQDMRDGWGEHRIEVLEEHDLGDRVLARARSTIIGPSSGISIPTDWSILITVREGKAVLIEFFIEHQTAFTAIGLDTAA